MSNRILLAHDWIGPRGPLINNQTYTGKLSDLSFNRYGLSYFEKVRGYIPVPSYQISDHYYFIYEIVLTHQDGGWVKELEMDLLSTCMMSPNILQRIRLVKGRGYLLLNLAEESVIDDLLFERIHAYCIRENIPLKKVIFQMGNADAEKIYKDYCIRKGFTSIESMLCISPIEYFEFKTSFLMKEHIDMLKPKNVDFNKIEKTFLCLNRNYRFHRSNLLLLFYRHDLLKHSYYSMPATSLLQDTLWKDSLDKSIFDEYKFTVGEVEEIQNTLPLRVDTDDIIDVNKLTDIWGNLDDYYNTSLISVVTETNYEHCVFNTEKIFKPIANRHPFIMVGPKGTLERLKVLGYKTFGEFWDESYDNIEDPILRLKAIGNLCKELSNWSDTNKKRIFYKTMAVTDYNYRLLKDITGDKFRRTFWHSFRDDIVFGK